MRSRDDLIERLAALNPVDEESLADSAGSPIANSILERILDSSVSGNSNPPQRRLRLRGRRVLFPVAATVSLGVLIAAVVAAIPGETGGGTSLAASLNAVAGVAIASDSADADAPYDYLRRRVTSVSTFVDSDGVAIPFETPELVEAWLREDGSGEMRTVDEEPVPLLADADLPEVELSEDAETRDIQAGSVAGDPSNLAIEDLPTNPDQLAEILADAAASKSRRSGPDAGVGTLELTAKLLADPRGSAELRSALFGSLAYIDGIELFGAAKDPQDRVGEAVGLTRTTPGGVENRYSLIFDPGSSAVLAYTWSANDPAYGDAPVIMSSNIFLESGGVEQVGDRPAGTPDAGGE